MASYRKRLEADLDGWIGRGLVPAESRAAILDSLGEARRLDAATALAVVGALLAGVAVIALVAANWSDIPRIVRFATILLAFVAVAGAAAETCARGRPLATQVLLVVAGLVFAAAIGLTGQIFDIAGSPQAALRSAALAAGVLALAGGSPWAGVLALAFLGLGELSDVRFVGSGEDAWPWWLGAGASAGAAFALRWRSRPLAHASGVASWAAAGLLYARLDDPGPAPVLVLAAASVALAAGARHARERLAPASGVLYGWWAWAALWCVAAAVAEVCDAVGLKGGDQGLSVSIVLLLVSGALVALGRMDRHGGVTAVGVLGLLGGGGMLLTSLGVSLFTSAAVFAAAAIVALVSAFLLRRRPAG